MKKLLFAIICCLLWRPFCGAESPASANPYRKWPLGPSHDPGFFPIAVWLQNPQKAKQYREAGINTYVALWNGPTEEQLAALKSQEMKLICHLNQTARKHLDDPTIIGWMHGDEPDNAQSQGRGKGYGPPIEPAKIVEDYEKLHQADPSRPVMLNLGQGVAWDGYYGRGVRTNHPEDYPQYMKGCDIVSFDIYPAAHSHKDISGNLWYVAKGVERLVEWSAGQKVVWNCIECTRIQADTKASPHQVRCEVWMSLIHGSKGLIYFVHEWKPKFNESALLSDPEMLSAVTSINQQIQRLAPVLNQPNLPDAVKISSDPAEVPIATLAKSYHGATYIFAVGLRHGKTTGTFTVNQLKGRKVLEVVDEQRTLSSENGVFQDTFNPWDAHIYRLPAQ